MTDKELKKLRNDLAKPANRGAKFALSVELGVDPSKITKALHGLVKDEKFMDRLQAKAMKLLGAGEADKTQKINENYTPA